MLSLNSVLQIMRLTYFFYHIALKFRYRYLSRQHISKRKNPWFVVYAGAARRAPSVTLWLRMLVQPPASPIGLLSEQQRKCYVFSINIIFTIWCSPLVIKFLILRSWLCLRSMCSVHWLREPKGALRFPEFGSWEHISGNKLFASKVAKHFSSGAILHNTIIFFLDFFSSFLKSSLAAHYVAC